MAGAELLMPTWLLFGCGLGAFSFRPGWDLVSTPANFAWSPRTATAQRPRYRLTSQHLVRRRAWGIRPASLARYPSRYADSSPCIPRAMRTTALCLRRASATDLRVLSKTSAVDLDR